MASSSHRTFYEILGINQQAKVKEIRDAYRKLALRCHPDKDPSNPRAVATFQKLSVAYETLSDGFRRMEYDATLISSRKTKQSPQPAWPPQTSSNPNDTTRLWRATMEREKADQARREDDEYWSGPTYYHGAYERNAWGATRDAEQKNEYNSKHQEGQRAARKEARREAERNKRYDDGSWTKSPSPQQPDPDWSERVKEKKEKKEESARRKAERELSQKNWPVELLLLFSNIIALQVDIERTQVKVDASRRSMKDDRHEEDHEQIFELPIKLKFLERRLQHYLDRYKRIVKLLRDRGWEQEANEAYVKLREVRKEASRHERVRRKETEQVDSTTESQTKGKLEHDQEQPSTSNQGSVPDQPCSGKYINTKLSPKPTLWTLPMHDGQDDEDETLQQHYSREDIAALRVSYDGSDPDRGFTEDMPEPSVASEEDCYGHDDGEVPFHSTYHDSHLEVHREFWDFVDSEHECNFCRNICTVMQCPSCDVQACAYCKDMYG